MKIFQLSSKCLILKEIVACINLSHHKGNAYLCRLKIRVSVVRFRPRPPNSAKAQPSEVGLFAFWRRAAP
jgi:hypothetical protein